MKKKITLVVCCLFYSCFIDAQSWSPPGAKWIYSFINGGSSSTGYVEVVYTGDTIINSFNCQKLAKWYHVYNHITFQYYDYIFGNEFTYEQNGVVYLYYNNGFDTLYNFSAAPGNWWRMAKHQSTFFECDSNSTIYVIDTGTVVINSVPLKFQFVQFNYIGSPAPPYQDTVIEKIGYINSYFLPYDGCFSALDANEGGPFRCYSDSNFATYKPHFPYNCDFILGENEIDFEARINISPNPATTTIFIERNPANTPATLQLLDCFGRKVEEIKIAAGEKRAGINVKSFAAGIYFVRLADEKEQVVRKVVVQH